ncbi:peptidase S8/S53 domain-containing protein [Auriculariales sp. MPI-PUGE-AT-0066]|nr:peptidase S8/S53 domain-containing protein [Auriculariales sp. MPI-PUGE-AT-0066]
MIASLLSVALVSFGVAASPLSTSHAQPAGAARTMTLAPLFAPPAHVAHNAINDSYIVMLKPGAVVSSHMALAQNALSANPVDVQTVSGGIRHVYDSNHVKGYSGRFSPAALEQLRAMPEVDYIEQDQVVFASDIKVQRSSTWGLARISHRNKLSLGTFNRYSYDPEGGDGVDVYVIDTGVNIKHVEFEGRAVWGKTIPTDASDVDNNGHGTHCAGTIGSAKYGVAKAANIIAVKVLGDNGSGSMADVIGGVTWASEAAQKKMKDAQSEFKSTGKSAHKGSVANMSLGGGKSRALDDVVNAAVDGGLHMAVAAGNDNRDACSYSPAAAEKAVTVGASTVSDERAYFSNYGSCVDIFALASTSSPPGSAPTPRPTRSRARPWPAHTLPFDPAVASESTTDGLHLSTQLSHEQTAIMTAIADAKPAFLLNWMPYIPGGRWLSGLIRRQLNAQLPIETQAPIPGSPGSITPAQLKKALIALGTRGVLSDLPDKTPNILIFNNATMYS